MRLASLTLALLFSAACSSIGPSEYQMRTVQIPAVDWSDAETDSWDDGEWAMLDLSAGQMEGRMPQVGTFDGEGYGQVNRDVWGGQEHMYLEINTLSRDGWAMMGLNLMIDSETGEATYSPYDVVGCAGPDEYQADFDESPDDVDVTAEIVEIDGEPMVAITVEGTFRGDNLATGVAYVPARPGATQL